MPTLTLLSASERKVLGALILMTNKEDIAICTNKDIANIMGYKTSGGMISMSLKMLEIKNYITTLQKGMYKIFV